jgi:hypothetical protein
VTVGLALFLAVLTLIACSRKAPVPSSAVTPSGFAREPTVGPAAADVPGVEVLSPAMLIAAPLPGSAYIDGPECASSWDAFTRLWQRGALQQHLARTPGLSGCRVRYRYVDAVGLAESLDITHATVLLRSEQDAETFLEAAQLWLASEGLPGDRPGPEDSPFGSESRHASGLADDVIGIEADDSNVLAIRRRNVVHVISLHPRPFVLDQETVAQFVRLVAGRSAGSAEEQLVAAGPPVRVPLRVYVAPDIAHAVPPDMDATIAGVRRIYASLSRTPDLVVAGWHDLGGSGAFDPRRDIAQLATLSDDCVVEVFYVAGTGREGGWGWVPTTSIFLNAALYDERLLDDALHARILAHELGHVWGLDHSEDPANLMNIYGEGELLTSQQAGPVAAYLEAWHAGCADRD